MHDALFHSNSRYAAILWPTLFDVNKRLDIPGTTGETNWREMYAFQSGGSLCHAQPTRLRTVIDDSDRTPLQGEDTINALKTSGRRIFPKVVVTDEWSLKKMLMWPTEKTL